MVPAFLAGIGALLGLGFWQLQRADEKAELIVRFAEEDARDAATALDEGLPHGRRVRLLGEYDDRYQWYLDNRPRQGQFGYEIIALFRPGVGTPALVNRGWLAGDPARRSRPAIPPVDGYTEIHARVYRPDGRVPVLAETPDRGDWPRLIQRVDIPEMETELGAALFPATLRLLPDAPGALGIYWRTTSISPLRHIAYAMQWLTMAGLLAALFIYNRIQRRRERRT